ncbi:hypothetical protein ACYSNW_03480 [Enterococcus sp. LJL99]
MTDNSRKVIKEINSTISVSKEKTFKAIETGIYLAEKEVIKKSRKKYYFIGLVATAMLTVTTMQDSTIVDAINEFVGEIGAKLTKIKSKDSLEVVPENISYSSKVVVYSETEPTITDFKSLTVLKPINLEKEMKITKELLMKFNWIVLDNYESDEFVLSIVQSSCSVWNFENEQVKISTLNTDTGLQILDKDDSIVAYSIRGNNYEEKITLGSGTELGGKYELSIVNGLLVMFPNDGYDHQKERQRVLQAVEITQK